MREHSIIGSNFIEFQKVKHKFKSFYTKTIVRTVSPPKKKKRMCCTSPNSQILKSHKSFILQFYFYTSTSLFNFILN